MYNTSCHSLRGLTLSESRNKYIHTYVLQKLAVIHISTTTNFTWRAHPSTHRQQPLTWWLGCLPVPWSTLSPLLPLSPPGGTKRIMDHCLLHMCTHTYVCMQVCTLNELVSIISYFILHAASQSGLNGIRYKTLHLLCTHTSMCTSLGIRHKSH